MGETSAKIAQESELQKQHGASLQNPTCSDIMLPWPLPDDYDWTVRDAISDYLYHWSKYVDGLVEYMQAQPSFRDNLRLWLEPGKIETLGFNSSQKEELLEFWTGD